MDDTGPPAPISQDSIEVSRSVDPTTGFVVTRQVSKTTGLEVGLSQTWHLQKADAGFQPPATGVIPHDPPS